MEPTTPLDINDTFDIKSFIKSKTVIHGGIIALLGIVITLVGATLEASNIRTIIFVIGFAISFMGTGKITDYINEKTVPEMEKGKKG